VHATARLFNAAVCFFNLVAEKVSYQDRPFSKSIQAANDTYTEALIHHYHGHSMAIALFWKARYGVNATISYVTVGISLT